VQVEILFAERTVVLPHLIGAPRVGDWTIKVA
jgi:hypothetical protein